MNEELENYKSALTYLGFKYIAVDKDGDMYAFKKKPIRKKTYWDTDKSGELTDSMLIDPDWLSSLNLSWTSRPYRIKSANIITNKRRDNIAIYAIYDVDGKELDRGPADEIGVKYGFSVQYIRNAARMGLFIQRKFTIKRIK